MRLCFWVSAVDGVGGEATLFFFQGDVCLSNKSFGGFVTGALSTVATCYFFGGGPTVSISFIGSKRLELFWSYVRSHWCCCFVRSP